MKSEQATNERSRKLFISSTVIIVLISLIMSFVLYLNDAPTQLRRLTLENMAKQFSASVTNSHWQWQGEGRPRIVMLSTYANKMGENDSLVETGKKPILMSHQGWPKVEPTSKGCSNAWKMLLNMPMDIGDFKVFADYYDGLTISNSALESVCRYRLSAGPYFEYKVFSGQVLEVKE